MNEVVADKNLVAACGLYCGACKSYLKEKCPGCKGNEKASWCQIRKCCIEKTYASCADCATFAEAKDCKKFNNFIGNIFGLIFNSDRAACVRKIKADGYEPFARFMAERKTHTIKRS